MVADRNQVESNWQIETNESHSMQEEWIRNARLAASVGAADSAKTRDDELADICAGQILSLLAPAEKYLQDVAMAQHDRAIVLSQTYRDFVEGEDAGSEDDEAYSQARCAK